MTITKTYIDEYKIWKITCDEDHMITSWKESDDIKSYSSFSIAYCPGDTDIDATYHLVTKAYDEERMKECEAAYAEEQENNNN